MHITFYLIMNFLKRKIFDSKNNVFGLDLSDLSVKVVQLQDNGEEQRVVSYGSAKISPGSMHDGEIKQKEQVVDAIKRAIASAGPKKINTKKAICSLPETKAFLRIVSIPAMDENEIPEAVKWEMEANIPLPLDQVYYDWQVLNKSFLEEKNRINLLVVAIAKTSVDQIVEVVELAGLIPVGMEIESIAQDRSLVDDSRENKTILIVDIGDRRTSFSITKNSIPCFTSSIPVCGQTMTESIASGLSISVEEAEKTKLQYGIGSDFKNDSIFKLVRPVLDNLAYEIERSVDFFISELQYSSKVDAIVICGGGANTKGLIPYLSKKIGRELFLGDPWTNIHLGKALPIIERKESVQYSTAIGLALKGIQS
jgi:type IV pilus assembly protein PilM